MPSSYEALLSLLLPEFILENFELKSARKEEEVLHIDLEEINSIPSVFEKDRLESKGSIFKVMGRKYSAIGISK